MVLVAVVAAVSHRIELGEIADSFVAEFIGRVNFKAVGRNLEDSGVGGIVNAAREHALLVCVHAVNRIIVHAGLGVVKAHGQHVAVELLAGNQRGLIVDRADVLVLGAAHAVDIADCDFQRAVLIDTRLIVTAAQIFKVQRCVVELDIKRSERQARVHLQFDFSRAEIDGLLNMKLKLGTQGHQEKDQKIQEKKGNYIEEKHITRLLFLRRRLTWVSRLLVGHKTPFKQAIFFSF